MGLAEIILAALCLNSTCVDDLDSLDKSYSSAKKLALFKLAEELKQEHLYITTLINGELSGYNSSGQGTGVAFDLINILQHKFGFNYSIVLPQKNIFGNEKSGVLALLEDGTVNISAAFLPKLNLYTNRIKYSPSLDTGEWVVLMKRPGESANGTGLLAPFTLPVWMLILVSLFLVGPIIYFVIYVQAKLCKLDDNKVYPLSSCIWFVYGALLKQGTTLNPTTDSSRLLFSTWWIFITILTAFYTANLTAFLTLSKFTLPIDVPEDIGRKNWKWVTNYGNAIQEAVALGKSSLENTEEFQQIYKTLGPQENYYNTTDAKIISRYVKEKNMMFIREKPIVEHVLYRDYKENAKAEVPEADRCTYVITKFSVMSFARSFAYTKHFKYAEVFDSAIQNLVEAGIIKFKLSQDLPNTQICPLDLGSTERRLRNTDLMMTYIIVGVGFVVSLIVFLVELLIQRCYKRDLIHMRGREHKHVNRRRQHIHTFETLKSNRQNDLKLPVTFGLSEKRTPPPSYNTIFQPPAGLPSNSRRKIVNGREYWVVEGHGENHLIPLRTPSALLFQYSN